MMPIMMTGMVVIKASFPPMTPLTPIMMVEMAPIMSTMILSHREHQMVANGHSAS
jgi:hypothetical protein